MVRPELGRWHVGLSAVKEGGSPPSRRCRNAAN